MTTSLTAPLAAPGVRLAALEAARPARLSWPRGTGYPAAGALQRHEVSERSTRLATAAAVGVALVFPPLQTFRIFTWQGGPGPGMWAVLAVALYLPLHVRHVWFAAHTRRPPAGAWTLAAMAVIVIGALPLVNSAWTLEFSWLAVSVLIVMPRPWSYLAAVGLVAATIPVALALGDPNNDAVWFLCAVLCRGATLFVLVWLAAVIRRLRAARQALAEEAVTRERLRIDGELRRTLGAALESIVARGERAMARLDDGAEPHDELRELVEDSRATLAEARRMVRSYQQVSLRAELNTAVALLTAAGIEARLAQPPGGFPDTIDDAPRAALRAALVRLLRADPPPRTCLIVVTSHDGRTTLELRTGSSSAQVVAA
jgi:two-component system, NarL family, sensor histidine kinase DesK